MRILIFLIITFLNISTAKIIDVSLALSWKHQFQFAGYYIAQEKGFYKDVGLNVDITEYETGQNISKDVSTQKVNFGIGHSSLILDRLNNYKNILMLAAINQSSPLVLISKKTPKIKTIADIKNKTIMMVNNQTYTASINAMLYSKGLSSNSFKIIPTSFNPVDIINGNADMMVSYSSNEPFLLKEKGVITTIFDPKDYGYDFYSDILFTSNQMVQKHANIVDSFYKATIKGWKYAYSHEKEAIDIFLNKYNTQNKSRKALEFEAKVLKKLAIKEGVKFGDINTFKLKEIGTTYRLLGLIEDNKKIDFENFIYNPLSKKKLLFTSIEKEYLLKKENLKICIDSSDMPFQGVENNKLIGISSDFIGYLETTLDILFEIVYVNSSSNALSFLKNKKCDIIPVYKGDIKKIKSLKRSDSYINIPLTIVTHKDSDYIFQVEDIKMKPIGIIKKEFQENEYSHMNIINQNSTKEAIKNVISKELFGFIGDIISVKKTLQLLLTNEVQLINNLNQTLSIYMLTRAEDKELSTILDKQIKQINHSKKYSILNKWMNTEYIKSFDYSLLWPIIGIILIILIFIIYNKINMNRLLKIKTAELNVQMEIFDENVNASYTNEDGKITYVSKAFCKKSGYNKEELIGNTHSLLRDKDTPNSLYQDMWMTIISGHTWRGEIKNISKEKVEFWVNCTISPMYDKNRNIIGFSAIREDITLEKVLQNYNQKLELEVKKRTIELERLSNTDKLTNINNRVKLDNILTLQVATFKRYNQIFSILILDIDFFKKVNDEYGHLKGDEILKIFSSILKASIRSLDTLGRWGGEEFLIICPNTNIEGALHLAEHIRKGIEEYQFDIKGSITASIGVAEISSSMSEKDIINLADSAMYKAKQSGRNRVIRG